MQPVAKTVGRYELLAELGRGAMGIVYKARDPKIDRLVAIKTISLFTQSPDEDREFRERLFVEARAAGRLSHPGIVTVFDVGEDPDTLNPFIVMEYVAGSSLEREVAERADKFPLTTSLALIEQVAEALDYAHSQGIVHRDIKPGNILLPENGPPKITDFGIAKFNFGHPSPMSDALGTPAFMSPEQLNGESVDGRSDLFSLGVVLYTLVTGYRPFQGNSALTVSFKVVNRDPLPATAFDSGFPPELDFIVTRAMAKDPGERYQTGKEMAAALRELRQLAEHSPEDKTSAFDAVYGTPSAHLIKGASLALQANAAAKGSSTSRAAKSMPAQRNHGWPVWQYVAVALMTLALCGFGIVIFRKPAVAPPLTPDAAASTGTPATSAMTPGAQNDSANIVPKRDKTPSKGNAHARMVASNAAPRPVGAISPTLVQAAEPTPAILRLRVEHRFLQAEVIIWVDDKLTYDHTVGGNVKKRMVVFKGVEGYQSDSVRVTPGAHQFRIRVHSSDNSYDQTASISGSLPREGERQLFIVCEKKKPIRLSLQ